jgi:hypothetical protein
LPGYLLSLAAYCRCYGFQHFFEVVILQLLVQQLHELCVGFIPNLKQLKQNSSIHAAGDQVNAWLNV